MSRRQRQTKDHTHDGHLAGQEAGSCSSGDLQQNPGILPLLPTEIHLARDVKITVDWTNEDQHLLESAKAQELCVLKIT